MKDFLRKIRNLHRRESGYVLFSSNPGNIRLDELLISTPLEYWPLPDKYQCPVSFCRESIERDQLHAHLSEKHQLLWNNGHFHSEFLTTLAGLLGTELQIGNNQHWTCPFPQCSTEYHDFSDISSHILTEHGENIHALYDTIGAFWMVIGDVMLQFTPEEQGSSCWPTINDAFEGDDNRPSFNPQIVPVERFADLWLSNRVILNQEWTPREQSPLDHLLADYFHYVSVEGWNQRSQSTFNILGRNCDHTTGMMRTLRHEQEKNRSWLSHQNQSSSFLNKEIQALDQFIHHFHFTLGSEVPYYQGQENPRAFNEQTEEEVRQSELARLWISQQQTDRDAAMEAESSDIEEWMTQLDELEHDNNRELDRSLPRSTQWNITQHEAQEPMGESVITPNIQPSEQPEDLFHVPETHVSQIVETRAQDLIAILQNNDSSTIEQQLEAFLESLANNPIQDSDRIPISLETPLIYALVQSKANAICRKSIFCPIDECPRVINTIPMLSNHLHSIHRFEHDKCTDMIQFFIEQMFDRQFQTYLFTIDETGHEETVQTHELLERCYHPHCRSVHSNHNSLISHMKNQKHREMKSNIDLLGWFWGIMKSNLVANPYTTIQDLLKTSEAYQCTADNCGRIFSSIQGLRTHFTSKHNMEDSNQWNAPSRKLWMKTVMASDNQNPIHNIPSQERDFTSTILTPTRERRFPHEEGILRSFTEQEAQREMDRRQEMNETEANTRQLYTHKRQLLLDLVQSGVNIPPLTRKDKNKLMNPLKELLKIEINPLLEQMMPSSEDWESWLTFEGIYEDALDKIRKIIVTIKGRNIQRLYGTRVLNPKLQQAREQISESLEKRQSVQSQLRKVKFFLQEIATRIPEEEGTNREPEMIRQNIKWTRIIAPILDSIPEETRKAVFGDDLSHESIWQTLNTSPDRIENVIEWLESLIISELEGELKATADLLHKQMVTEAYNTTKSIAMRRYINKKHSPPCAIDKDQIHQFFQNSWATPPANFEEATPNSPLFLEARIPESATEMMKEFMLNEKNITEVISSRSDIGACGPDGINNLILKSAGKEGIRFMKNIIQGCITCGRVMESWKRAKTILIYKKGDRTDPQNWRPISITNCLYRVFTCLMARCFQEINTDYQLFSDHQKGFIKKTNGCTEHGIILNELFHDARRNHKGLVITAIDFTNAFGSVPHELILSAMKQRNFPEWTRNIVQDMYTNASSFIELRGDTSKSIGWKKGVKQGCPLSPLLFNLCLEPLLQLVKRVNKDMGAYVDIDENTKIENLIQAYADDVALISERPEGIESMLKSLEIFTKWSKMEVNVKKCSTASYLLNDHGHRCSLTNCFKFQNQDIPNLTLSQSLKYLGTAVAARRNVKLHATISKFDEMKTLVRKIMGSPLLTVQKIDAIKTFVIPCFDFLMLNGDISKTRLDELDSFIRGQTNKLLKIPGLPVECHHMSWRDGGFSIPSLLDRSHLLSICSFAHMVLSKDTNIRTMTRAFIESERKFRHITIETDSTSYFLNWKDGEGSTGTASFINNARRATNQLNVHLQLEPNQLTIGNSEIELKTNSPAKIGRFLTQKIIRPALAQKVTTHPLKGASFPTLRKNECSNKFLRNTFTHRSNAFFRFAVAGRADSLPTPANIQKWYNLEEENCFRCNQNQRPTLAHILNSCSTNFRLMTDRHNRIVRCVRRAIENHIPRDLIGGINENTSIPINNLSEETRHLRPDIWFIRRERNEEILEILEFCCPFGRIETGQCTLKKAFEHKMHKYQHLADDYTSNTRKTARVHPIIVSSLGAVYNESLKCLKSILRCRDKELIKLGTWMSEQAILGSFKLWIDYQKSNEHHHDQEEVRAEIDLANQERIEVIENEEDNEEEIAEEENWDQEIRSPFTDNQELTENNLRQENEAGNDAYTNHQILPNEI
jgi:hypothetical protein